MNPPFILVVSSKYPPEYAGSGLRAHRTYLRLREKTGVQFEVIANGLTHRENESYTHDGVRVHRIAGPFGGIQGGAWRRLRILGDAVIEWLATERVLRGLGSRVDLIHTFGNSWSVAAATFFSARRKLPLIRELVNEMPDPHYPVQLKALVQSTFERDCAVMIAISRRLQTLCCESGVRDCRYRLNPVDEHRFYPRTKDDRRRLRRELTSFSDEDKVLVHVANYIPRKNHVFAVKVLARLPEEYKLFLGGPLRESERETFREVQDTIDRLGLGNRVDLNTGFIENIEDYIQLSDVFLFPTWAEGLGTPILEAQACARPVIANRMKGITDDAIVPGRGGFAVELDPDLWVSRIREAINISEITLKENAQEILSRASTATIDKWYTDLIRELVERCGGDEKNLLNSVWGR